MGGSRDVVNNWANLWADQPVAASPHGIDSSRVQATRGSDAIHDFELVGNCPSTMSTSLSLGKGRQHD